MNDAQKKIDLNNLVKILNRQFSGVDLPIKFSLFKSNPQKISLEISRTDITSNMVFLSPLDAFGNFTGVSIFTNDLMEVLAQINLFKDFENVAVVDLSLVNKTYLPKIMSMPKSEIRKKFSKSIETRIWTETMIEKIKILS